MFTVFSKQDRLRKETCARSDCHLHFLEQTFVYVCVSEVKVVSDVESGAGSLVTPFKNEEINIRSFFSIFFSQGSPIASHRKNNKNAFVT